MKTNDCLQTPAWVYEPLGHFDLDPCADLNTHIADNNWCAAGFYGFNGLELCWATPPGPKPFVWCNPPFSQKALWIDKMILHNHGILILPERASAPWFGPLAHHVGQYFIMGKKINFIGGPSSNNLGSCLFPFGETARERLRNSGLPGMMVEVLSYKGRD
jgi:hypothetical protein